MPTAAHIDNPRYVLIGSGVMSAHLGVMLKRLDPTARLQVYEVASTLSPEASDGWHNAGTGHAGLCELSYTPHPEADGSVDVSNALDIFHQFEHSRQFWASAVRDGLIDTPSDFIRPVPHISFVQTAPQVDFLRARYQAMQQHHFFSEMAYTEDRDQIARWAPLLVEGRSDVPIASTRVDAGTDVNFGAAARKLLGWLAEQDGCGVATRCRVVGLDRTAGGWRVTVRDEASRKTLTREADFVFIGAGGGSLPLLQKSGIDESKGFGGFPIGGQWLVCDKPEIVERHHAKVYGQALGAAPTMAVPHLDTRVIDGKRAILFGPFAAWTTKFLHEGGRHTDLLRSVKLDNIGPMTKVGLYNLPLVKYLIQQGLQSMESRMKELRTFYPDANRQDWHLVDAGIRVQAIKREDGQAGIVHYGTEIVTDADRTLSALLGASPGASVCAYLMLGVIRKCLPQLLEGETGRERMGGMIPQWDEDLRASGAADRYRALHGSASSALGLSQAEQVG